jgi:hypothetical protein
MDSLFTFSLIAFIYFLPTLIAAAKAKKNGLGILTLNLFLGWTFIGWVIALIWSVMHEEKTTSTTP